MLSSIYFDKIPASYLDNLLILSKIAAVQSLNLLFI